MSKLTYSARFGGRQSVTKLGYVYRQEDMELAMKTNFHGPLNITRAVLPKMRARGSGTLLYVSSQAAWHADPGAGSYCASKAALESMSSPMITGNILA